MIEHHATDLYRCLQRHLLAVKSEVVRGTVCLLQDEEIQASAALCSWASERRVKKLNKRSLTVTDVATWRLPRLRDCPMRLFFPGEAKSPTMEGKDSIAVSIVIASSAPCVFSPPSIPPPAPALAVPLAVAAVIRANLLGRRSASLSVS